MDFKYHHTNMCQHYLSSSYEAAVALHHPIAYRRFHLSSHAIDLSFPVYSFLWRNLYLILQRLQDIVVTITIGTFIVCYFYPFTCHFKHSTLDLSCNLMYISLHISLPSPHTCVFFISVYIGVSFLLTESMWQAWLYQSVFRQTYHSNIYRLIQVVKTSVFEQKSRTMSSKKFIQKFAKDFFTRKW